MGFLDPTDYWGVPYEGCTSTRSHENMRYMIVSLKESWCLSSLIWDISIIGGVNQREFCPFYQGFPKYFAIRFKERKQRKLYDRDWTSHFLELFNVRILRVYFERGKQTFLFAYHVCFSYHGCNVQSLGICWKKIRFSKRKNYIFRICAKKNRASHFSQRRPKSGPP